MSRMIKLLKIMISLNRLLIVILLIDTREKININCGWEYSKTLYCSKR